MDQSGRYTEMFRRMLTDVLCVTGGRTCGIYLVKEERLQMTVSSGGELPKVPLRTSETHDAWRKKKIKLHCDARVGATIPAICGEEADVLTMCSPIIEFDNVELARSVDWAAVAYGCACAAVC